jgi:hypothetical protein
MSEESIPQCLLQRIPTRAMRTVSGGASLDDGAPNVPRSMQSIDIWTSQLRSGALRSSHSFICSVLVYARFCSRFSGGSRGSRSALHFAAGALTATGAVTFDGSGTVSASMRAAAKEQAQRFEGHRILVTAEGVSAESAGFPADLAPWHRVRWAPIGSHLPLLIRQNCSELFGVENRFSL